jgi:hypothetical protein
MKRQNLLFERVADYHNIRLAFLKAIRGNRSSPQAVNYCKSLDKNLSLLRNKLLTMNYEWGGYKSCAAPDTVFGSFCHKQRPMQPLKIKPAAQAAKRSKT